MRGRLNLPAATVLLALATTAAGQQDDLLGRGIIQPPTYGQLLTIERLVPSQVRVSPGATLHVAVVLRVSRGWVYYSPAPGGGSIAPIPASMSVQAGDMRVVRVLWPADKPHQTDIAGQVVTNYVYADKAVAYVELSVPADAKPGPRELAVAVAGQVCSDKEFKCVPVRAEGTTPVTVDAITAANGDWTDDLAAGLSLAVPADRLRAAESEAWGAASAGQLATWTGLGLAVLAGLIMNIMPCVLPVLPIRILSVIELARQSRRRFVTVGLAYAAGVLSMFVGLAGANVVLRVAAGRTLDWGRHFQSAPLRVGMAMVVTAMAVNLFGAFTVLVPRRLAELDSREKGQGHLASFAMGLMTAILATPCSFAILVVAFAWAQVQPLWLGSLAIVLIGVGMAAPHAMLVAVPSLVSRLPRPGRWMDLLRQAMGFVLLLVAVWLIGTLSESNYIAWVAGYGVVLSFCLWVWGTWVRYDWPAAGKLAMRAVAIALAVAAGWWMLRPGGGLAVKFETFDQQRISQARGQGKVVLVDFTAAWCLSCRVIDATIYDDKRVADALTAQGVLAMRGDVTTADLPANEMLYQELKGAPPLTVVLPPSGPPIRLEGEFSVDELLGALDRAASPAGG